MRERASWLWTIAAVLAACSGDKQPMQLPQLPGAGSAGMANVAPPGGAPSVPNTTAGTTAPPKVAGSGAAGVVAVAGAGTAAPAAGMPAAMPPTAAGAGAGAAGGGVAGTAPPAAGTAAPMMGMFNTEPVIPEPMGECPEFTSGTKTIMGLGGISLQAGAKQEGKGGIVFYWHGTGSSAAEGAMFPGRSELMSEGGVFVAFGRSLGTGGDCSGTATFSRDDFKIVDQIVACAVKNHGINPKRIYTTGCSAGGLMAGCMGIMRSNYTAATAPNSGGITIGYGKHQDTTRVPAVMTMHGRPGGDVVIVDFSQTSEAYDNYMTARGSFAINCNHGGGHCGAPGSLQSSAWQFMKDHPFGTRPSPYANGLPMGFHQSCKIWTPTMRQPLGEGGMRM